MVNPFLKRQAETANLSNSHRRSKKQEKQLAVRFSAKQTAASGAKDIKGDLRIKGVVRIEAKTTKNKSFSVTEDMINKIEMAAVTAAEVPIIVVEFHDGFGKVLREVAVMPMYALQTLLDGQAK
jgi:hypothetical protein